MPVPMALCPFPPPVLLLTILLAFAASTRATAGGNLPAPAPAPTQPPSDSRFLRACCANTTNESACFDSLIPLAGSFHGNRVHVARAAAVLAFARLRVFHDEVRRLQPPAGAGRVVDMALELCATSAEVSLGREGDSLAELRRLETAGGRSRGEQAERDLYNARLYVAGIAPCATSCVDDLDTTGDAVLASPVGKKVVAWAADVHLCGDIALDLVTSIKL